MRRSTAILFLFVSGALPAQGNPRYTYWIDGPCGETVVGPPGSVWDDGTGGAPYFDPRPGQTWDVVLTTAENPDHGVWIWRVALGVEGALRITDASVNGTAGCELGDWPECRRRGGIEVTEVTGPPDGTGPHTRENGGVVSSVVLAIENTFLPPEGSEKVLKIRVRAEFPDGEDEVVVGRVFFATRTGTFGPISPEVVGPGGPLGSGGVTVDAGDPPLTVRDCEVTLRASSVAAFRRCDPNDDGRLNLADGVWILNELFRGRAVTRCPAAADCNGDGNRDLSDAVYGLRYFFTHSPPPPFPFPDCGWLDLPGEECPPGSTRCP